MKTAILMPTRDRSATVSVCLPAWVREKADMDLWIFDDGSEEYGPSWLLEMGADHVVVQEDPIPPSAWSIARNILRGLTTLLYEGYNWIYVADSDTYPTEEFRVQMLAAMDADPFRKIYSFFNSSHQAQHYQTLQTHTKHGIELLERDRCPGCSMLLNGVKLSQLEYPFGVDFASHEAVGAWDHLVAMALAPVVITRESLVEHLGDGGLHNPGSWEIDRALNPTPFLAREREPLIRQIMEKR